MAILDTGKLDSIISTYGGSKLHAHCIGVYLTAMVKGKEDELKERIEDYESLLDYVKDSLTPQENRFFTKFIKDIKKEINKE